ncbi:hypothetical protein [Streptomyces oceani]|uniref:Uncharacterized protein n=1 Tax=Streptomyces oceani TaxID=1075402 RepID=A0A1E7KIF8_9ACTN|nr:hypothetical protein [Streptomyces oceani]OEV03634.1 hypothetical protein AN216_10200 [Streptomyces oceani]
MPQVSVKIDEAVRDRLAAVAAERKTSIAALVEQLSADTLPHAERVARMERTRAHLRETTGVVITDDDVVKGSRLLRDIAEGRGVEVR